MEQQLRALQSIAWKTVSDRSKDLVIALMIALIGLTGTYMILGKSIRTASAVSSGESTSSASGVTNIFSSEVKSFNIPKSTNEENLIVQGIFAPDQLLKISYMNFQSDKKYMLDFGNGIRRIVRNSTNYMKYQEPGIYYIAFYEMVNNQWELASTQAVTIKDINDRINPGR